jgi:putative Ca2+/H+ antiporter (TMEM165/GDT1 family)
LDFTTFVSVFVLVFVGELGDKTQFAAGTGTLAHPGRVKVIFLSSVLALVAVTGLTTFLAGLIPESALPTIVLAGGILLIVYGTYLFIQTDTDDDEEDNTSDETNWALFVTHFFVVFLAELGDKSQIFTAGAAVNNHDQPWTVFAASVIALTTVTAVTVCGVTLLPENWSKAIQRLGAMGMIGYGLYMIFFR